MAQSASTEYSYVLALLLLPTVLEPAVGREVQYRNAKSFDWEELTRLAHRALPTTDEDPEANDCEAQLPALRDAPLATHPPQEALQGYLPERLRPGQHVRGFQLTSFVRRIPLLPPIAVPASTTDVTRSTALQVMQSRDNNAELPLGDLALPGKFRDETLALPSPPSAALVLFDPATSMAVETAVLDSLLALPPATTQSIGMTPTAVGTEVALARVRPASLSPAEQTWVDEQMLAKVESESSVKRQRRAATVSMESAHESSGDGVPGYNMGDRIGHGHHGEVWRAVRARQSSDSSSSDRNTERNQDDAREKREQYVLKRIFVEKGLDIRLSGLREVYFGELLKPLALTSVARYVEWFERIDDSKKGEGRREVWIVFVDEGNSLHNLLYTDDAEADARDNDVDLHGQKISRSRSKLTSKGTLGDQRMAEGKQDQSAERTDRDEEEGTRPEGTPASDGVSVVAPSRLWHAIKADMVHADGEAMREVLRQVLVALAEVHQEGRVIHRDIKPENMIVALNVHHRHKQDHNGEYDGPRDNTNDAGQSGGAGTNRGSTPLIRLADFGSAYSEEMPKELWPPPHRRPSRAEETTDYSPPEVLFHPLIGTLEKDNDGDGEHNVRRGVPYDIWSVGVTWLELITGTSKVWGITDRARALIETLLPNESQAVKQMSMTLRSMADMCIFVPGEHAFHSTTSERDSASRGGVEQDMDEMAGESADQRKARIAAERAKSSSRTRDDKHSKTSSSDHEPGECGDAEVAATLRQRDPHGVGLPDEAGRDLLRRMLTWEPDKRITAQEALEHPYMTRSTRAY